MPDAPRVTAWLHCFDTDGCLAEDTLASALRQVGVVTHRLGVATPPRLGIVAFDKATPTVADFVRRLSHNGQDMLLAITTGGEMARGVAWQVLQAGAFDVLAWDRLSDPAAVVAARLQRWQAVDDILDTPLVRHNLVGRGRAWLSTLRQIVEAARFTDASILLTGETGTGKELAARLIHALSPQRSSHDLIVLDCTTLVPDLAGSELFGHERGAFTGAVTARDGAFALAAGSTLFLDEVGELPLALQAQLLRVVQERTYKRVGSNTWHTTDFRLVCATNRDLLAEEAQGRFRRDLYYRVATWTFRLPPLRERTEDILTLARHFLRQFQRLDAPPELDEPVQEYLLSRDYPGNIRDLRNLTLRMAHRHVGRGPITIGDIPTDERPTPAPDRDHWRDITFEQSIRRALLSGAGLREIRHAAEDTAIHIAMGEEDGNLQRAARRLGLSDRALQLRRAEQRQKSALDEAV